MLDARSTLFEQPSITVDLLVFSIGEGELKVVLIKRGSEPFKERWALPGGFVRVHESLEDAAQRELLEETGIRDVYLEQLYTFGEPDRDPRARVITVAYFALLPQPSDSLAATADALEAAWFPVKAVPPLAFDHGAIFQAGVERLRSKIEYSSIAYALLPERFRLSDLQRVYEIVLDRPLDKRNFRKKILSLGLLESTGEREIAGAHRPAMLYRFKKKEVVFFD